MWIIILLVCFTKIFASSSQYTPYVDSQIAAADDQANEEMKRDNIRHPVTVTIQNGRSDNIYRPQDEVSVDDQELFYSNQWQPFIMPIGYNPYESRRVHQTGSDNPVDHRFISTFLHRPDLDLNRTSTIDANTDISAPTQIPISPIVLYPNRYNLYPKENSDGNNVKVLQNSTKPQTSYSDSTASSSEEDSEILSPIIPDTPRRYLPADFYRSPQGYLPSNPAYFRSYRALPFPKDDYFRLAINPYFNRELGSIFEGNFPPEISTVERPTVSEISRDNESISEEYLPSDVPPNIESPLLPVPVRGYPFMVLPPSLFVPPLIPSTPGSQQVISNYQTDRMQPFINSVLPRSLSLNPPPFSQFTNKRTENPTIDRIQPPSPVLTTFAPSPPLQSDDSLSEEDILESELDIAASVKVKDDDILQEEKPNRVKVPYEFGFDMNDGFGTDQHRKEVSDGSGSVIGSYGYRDSVGVYRLVRYIADENGFRAVIKSNEPGVASSGSAHVVVMAEPSPTQVINEEKKVDEFKVTVAADETVDLIPEENKTEK